MAFSRLFWDQRCKMFLPDVDENKQTRPKRGNIFLKWQMEKLIDLTKLGVWQCDQIS